MLSRRRHRAVRSFTTALHRAAQRRRLRGAVDARREPDQVAPGAHHLVLRDLRARPRRARLSRRSTRATASSSTRTTRRSAPGIRGPSAACSRGRRVAEVHALPRARRRARCSRCSSALERATSPRCSRCVELGPAPRAAAPGADPHRHQARASLQPAAARVPRAGAARRRRPPAPPLRWIDYAGGLRRIGHAGDGFAFDNEGPRHRVFARAVRARLAAR